MSLQRKKVEVDPLSFFIEEDHKKLFDDEPEPEPEQETQKEPIKLVRHVEQQGPLPVKEIPQSKGVKFADPEPLKEETPKPVLKSALKSSKPAETSQKKTKDNTSIDVLFSAEYNRKTELLLSSEEDFFASEENSPKPRSPVPTTSNVTNLTKSAAIDFKKTDDDDISDLQVSKLLEREKGLDEQLFGNSSSAIPKNSKPTARNTELDAEQDFLKELDEITISSKSKLASSLSKSNEFDKKPTRLNTSSIGVGKKIDIDINALDINSYINQESNDDSGGLFD